MERSLSSDHKVPSSIPGSTNIWTFVRSSFPPKLTQLSILLGYIVFREITCDGLVSHTGGVKDSHPFNTIQTGDKRRHHGPLGS